MSQILFANLASTTLAVAISSVATTLNVAAGTGTLFPNPGTGQYFKITLYPATGSSPAPEIMHVTSVSSDTFTILRAQEGTTAQAWGVSSIIDNLLTRDTMVAFPQMLAYAGNPNTYVAGQAAGGSIAPSFCWDSTDGLLYVCTTSGPAFTAVWTPYYGGVPFTPVQQGGGTSQLTNKVYIGWDGTGLRAQVDSTDLGELAPLNSPSFSGTPLAPTATFGTSTTQIASTAFVHSAISQGYAAQTALVSTVTSGGGYYRSLTFVPTTTGYIQAIGAINIAGLGIQPIGCQQIITVNSINVSSDETIGPMTNVGVFHVTSGLVGTTVTVASQYLAGVSGSTFYGIDQILSFTFMPGPG